jgi:transglutaminase-like putative cysteine protease
VTSHRPHLLPAAEALLAALSLAAIVGFTRLFDDASFLPMLLAAAASAHLVAVVVRRRGLSTAAGVATTAVAMVLVGAWLLFPHTTAYGAPTLDSFTEAGAALSRAWNQFGLETAPVPPYKGFLLAALVGIWVGAAAADRAAFRSWTVLPPVIPATALFVVGALLARDDSVTRRTTSALFLGAVLAFVLVQRQVVQASHQRWRWLPTDEGRGTGAVLRQGALIGVVAALMAAVAGPALPWAASESLVDWRPGEGQGGQRETVSPTVDIKKHLLDRPEEVLFTVTSDERAYWRTTSLEIFDGQLWRSSGSFREADGELPGLGDGGASADAESFDQQVEVRSLQQIWLPAAFEPSAVDGHGTPLRFDPASSTLITDSQLETSDGISYAVRSASPRFDPADLQAASDPPPPEIADRYLGLPDDFSERATELARQATASAITPYDQALALQMFFREGFTYSLEVDAGDGEEAIERFLDSRSGYCQQFAGTFAAMARSLGLPSRVAVGFTPGDVDPADPGRYLVRGRHSHAWPEVWLTGAGWVPFEPTPGRGIPAGQEWTGVPEDQDGGVPTATATTAVAPTTTAPASGGGPSSTVPQEDQVGTTAASAEGGGGLPLWLVPVAAAGVVAAWALAIPALRAKRRRRQLGSDSPTDRVLAAWDLSMEDLGSVGLRPRSAETPAEVAARSGVFRLLDPEVLHRLAEAVTAARYAPDGVQEELAEEAVADAGAVHLAVQTRLSRRDRLRRRLDPRPLLHR